MSNKKINKLLLDSAEAVSYNLDSANIYLNENKINIDDYISKGLKELDLVSEPKPKMELSKSKSFFRRIVLAAKITHECYNEWTFGSVKFQKMVYLCEQVSEMNFSTNYSKQAAGPMDNKFIHSIKSQFESHRWFSVKKIKNGNYEKVQFTPLEGVDGYIQYYSNYYQYVDNEIQHLIDTFRKWKTHDVELVATIYACWDEINKEKTKFSNQLIIKKIYAWHKKKKKFSEDEILKMKDWMSENGIYPVFYN